jgi:FlaA1/EpsC-like NDP-sugar epimerase
MVTHPDVSRYFMTIPEAARLVLQAQALSDSGDVFVLDMGEPVKIVDLARMMITLSGSNAGIEFTGLRPAEKLHEVLTSNGEQIVPTTAAKVMRMSAVPIPIHDLNQRLDDIAGSARARDGEDLRVKLEALVPGFVAASGRASHGAPLADTRGLDPEMETVL